MYLSDNDGGGTLNIDFSCSASIDMTIDTIASMFELGRFIGVDRGE